MNEIKNYQITDGNTVTLQAPAVTGRVHMEGSGEIHAFVSTNAVNYTEVTHYEEFDNGVAEFPIDAYAGDFLKFTADSITRFDISWTMPERSAR